MITNLSEGNGKPLRVPLPKCKSIQVCRKHNETSFGAWTRFIHLTFYVSPYIFILVSGSCVIFLEAVLYFSLHCLRFFVHFQVPERATRPDLFLLVFLFFYLCHSHDRSTNIRRSPDNAAPVTSDFMPGTADAALKPNVSGWHTSDIIPTRVSSKVRRLLMRKSESVIKGSLI